MTDLHPLAGVYAAAVTPLKYDSTLDLEAVPVLLRFLASRGCHGALLFGTTGEGFMKTPVPGKVLPLSREAAAKAPAALSGEIGPVPVAAGFTVTSSGFSSSGAPGSRAQPAAASNPDPTIARNNARGGKPLMRAGGQRERRRSGIGAY